MAFWIWVVALSVIGLMVYELVYRIKRRNNPPSEEPDGELVDETQAELARANMKIAMLESRLAEAHAAQEEQEQEKAALLVQHRQQLKKTEEAYQRQMVTLSERLAANNKGDWRIAVAREKEQQRVANERYEVRMAAEVAAWKATNLAEAPLAQTAGNGENIDTPGLDPAEISAEFEDTASAGTDVSEESWLQDEQIEVPTNGAASNEIDDSSESDHDDPLDSAVWQTDHDQELLDQIALLDDAAAFADAEPAAREPEGEREETAVVHENSLVDDYSADDPQVADRSEHTDATALDAGDEVHDSDSEMAAEADAAAHHEKAGSPEEPSQLENRWPDLEEQAMQRVMARRLASEMDADYLDDEEFLKEMGIEQQSPPQDALAADEAQDMTSADNWPRESMHETAGQINGEPPFWAEASPGEELASEEQGSSSPEIADHFWEEMVFAGAAEARESGAAAPEEIDQDEAYSDQQTLVEKAVQDVPQTAVSGARDDSQNDPQGEQDRPSVEWDRQPVLWQAEYYDNTTLTDEPVIVRQDPEIDFQWGDLAPVDGVQPGAFSVRWSGRLPLIEGQYRFTVSAPDGMRLWLNDRLAISAWYDQSEQIYQRDFAWRGGSIDVCLEHYENGGEAKAFFSWDRLA